LPPLQIVWNGRDNSDMKIADGIFVASFDIYYTDGSKVSGKSDLFFLDTTAPYIQVSTDKAFFTPDDDGIDDNMYIGFTSAEDLSGIKSWKMAVYNAEDDHEFSSITGREKPSGLYSWNGKSDDGLTVVESATNYPLRVFAEDFAGNKSINLMMPISVGVLVNSLDHGRYKISINSIRFNADTSVMNDNVRNKDILDILANALNKYPEYKIVVEGYANRWKKNLDEGIAYDLSIARSKVIVAELVKRGVNAENLLVSGKGFKDPIVPLKIFMSIEEKSEMKINRRVEFYMQKQKKAD